MVRILEKTERRLGEKLFIKGDRCLGPKCGAVRRNYPPGMHGKKRTRRREASGFGVLLNEKQKIRFLYGLDDRDIARYSKEASSRRGIFSVLLLQMLEKRLDNVVFRLGFSDSRRMARQLVSHGHVRINGKRVRSPSLCVQKGDIISLNEAFLKSPAFAPIETRLKKYDPPHWLSIDKVRKQGGILEDPKDEDIGVTIDVAKIKEFYSR